MVGGLAPRGHGVRIPRATYRLQLDEGTTFADAAGLVPYLAELGVSDLYASPYLKARRGSAHGYDVVDHRSLNPELGSEVDYGRLAEALREQGMGQLLDIVPNHVGVGSDNAWWLDVLKNGPASTYARFFDIDWRPEDRVYLWGRVLLPVLGGHYRAVLESGEIRLAFDADAGVFSVYYYEHRFPIDPRTYPMILAAARSYDEGHPELERLADAFGALPGRDAGNGVGRVRAAADLKADLAACAGSAEVKSSIEERVRRLNDEPGSGGLHRLLEAQAYRLAYWRVAGEEINYRRFFAVNDLAGIRVEEEEVFEAVHGLVLRLMRSGMVDGLRIDHPDGLHDPAGYFRRLQDAVAEVSGEPAYVLVEKILAPDERLPDDWPVAGTTGYEFTNSLNGLFVDAAGESGLDGAYEVFLGQACDFQGMLYGCKRRMMRTQLASELDALARRLRRIYAHERSYDFTLGAVREALAEVVAHFPVYRTYIVPGRISEADRRYVELAVSDAKEGAADLEPDVFAFIRDVLLSQEAGTAPEPDDLREMKTAFVMKFQQYTGPVMAKGMEDTALYVYNRLVSLNEVGGEPEHFGVSVSGFHQMNAERLERWPHSMLSTSTHDTKRSEDVRARIDVLSEIPDDWRETVGRWSDLNGHLRREVDGEPAPSRNDEYLLYQTLVGAWPLGALDTEDLEAFRARIKAYMEKATREAQVRTSWNDVNEAYEETVAAFVDALIPTTGDDAYLRDFLPFQRRVARLGALNSLSQTLLKLTAPGVPDIYQGNELWDFSLVDPDNRRPVDFGMRARLLSELRRMDPSRAHALVADGAWQDGRPKLYLVHKALDVRRAYPALFEEGSYEGLRTSGEQAGRIVAFARRRGADAAITVAPRLCANMLDAEGPLLPPPGDWTDTSIHLPDEVAGVAYRNVLTGERVVAAKRDGEPSLRASDLLRGFPVALLRAER
jgi:(1->4)-alpha-D-glucan 1-alpha-D-glucosylmutase